LRNEPNLTGIAPPSGHGGHVPVTHSLESANSISPDLIDLQPSPARNPQFPCYASNQERLGSAPQIIRISPRSPQAR
jgi:hypothetical protein